MTKPKILRSGGSGTSRCPSPNAVALVVRMACIIICASAVTGCWRRLDPPPPNYVFTDPKVRFPITIARQREMLDIGVGYGKSGMSMEDRANVEMFLSSYRRDGNGMLFISKPSGGRHSAAAFALSELQEIIEEEGIDTSEIRITRAAPGGYGSALTLTYYREVAQAAPCGDWSQNLAHDRQNAPYPNLGCAQRNNLAAMVARPSDLVRVRSMTDRSNRRRQTVMDKYVEGDRTNAKKEKNVNPTTTGSNAGG